jgi:hypothetical protein
MGFTFNYIYKLNSLTTSNTGQPGDATTVSWLDYGKILLTRAFDYFSLIQQEWC